MDEKIKNKVSGVVLIGEEDSTTLEICLKSLLWCTEIILIVDSQHKSYLKMLRILQKDILPNLIKINPHIFIYTNNLDNDFSKQRNYALTKTKTDWVLYIDSDERILDSLRKEIQDQITDPHNISIAGFYFKRDDYIFGKKLQHGETSNLRLLRLARKNKGKWVGKVHETWTIEGDTMQLKNPIIHQPHQVLSSFLEKINVYTDILSDYWYKIGKKIHFYELFIYPLGKFIDNYFFKLGILDGSAGLIMAIMMSFHSFLARAKLWMYIKNVK